MNIKQFFNLLRQQRLFSGIYITSTTLSTALTMTLFLVLYIMMGPIYPEQERSRMAVLSSVCYAEQKYGGYRRSGASMELADSLRNMPEVECLTAINALDGSAVKGPDGERVPCVTQLVDADYWRVFSFRFICGRPFTRTEGEANSEVCVISEGMARRLFGHTDLMQRVRKGDDSDLFVRNNGDKLIRVVGIVEDASAVTPQTYAQMWVPTEAYSYHDPEWKYQGQYELVMLVRDGNTVEQLQKSVDSMVERVNQERESNQSDYRLRLEGQPYPHWQNSIISGGTDDWQPFMRKMLGLLLAFLLIPAMNMSSMVASRINARVSEMGIRRAYGAKRTTLLWQVLQENFLLTLIGSLAGLALSWLIMTLGADWLPFIFNPGAIDASDMSEPIRIHADMLFSGRILLTVLAVSIVLNLVSALVPTAWILHRSVTEAINHKR